MLKVSDHSSLFVEFEKLVFQNLKPTNSLCK
jgi:hypothetical protein